MPVLKRAEHQPVDKPEEKRDGPALNEDPSLHDLEGFHVLEPVLDPVLVNLRVRLLCRKIEVEKERESQGQNVESQNYEKRHFEGLFVLLLLHNEEEKLV